MYTTRFKIKKKITFCPQSVFVCFICLAKQRMIMYLYSINWFGFWLTVFTALYDLAHSVCFMFILVLRRVKRDILLRFSKF